MSLHLGTPIGTYVCHTVSIMFYMYLTTFRYVMESFIASLHEFTLYALIRISLPRAIKDCWLDQSEYVHIFILTDAEIYNCCFIQNTVYVKTTS